MSKFLPIGTKGELLNSDMIARFTPDSWLFFGKETAGLPEWFRMAHRERCIRLPMRREARSLNLSNSVAILTYEALRQNGFPGLTGTGEMAE